MYKSNWYVAECSGWNVDCTIFFTVVMVSVGRNFASIHDPSGKQIFSWAWEYTFAFFILSSSPVTKMIFIGLVLDVNDSMDEQRNGRNKSV